MSRNTKKRMFKLGFVVIFVFVLTIFSMIFVHYVLFAEYNVQKQEKQQVIQEQMLENSVEVQEKILNEDSLKTRRLIQSVSDEPEVVLLKESGRCIIEHDKTPSNSPISEWLINSDIKLRIDYTAVLTIKTSNVEFTDNADEELLVNYDSKNIEVSAITIDKIVVVENTSICGERYSPQETSALLLLLTNKVKEEVKTDESTIFKAKNSLENYLKAQALKYGIYSVNVQDISEG